MKGVGRFVAFVAFAIALVAFGYWLRAPAASTPVAEAISQGKAEIESAVAAGSEGASATMTLRRGPGVSGLVRVILESGTVLHAGENQRLIVAAPVVFELDDEHPTLTQTINTFCIDEFRATPTEGTAIRFAPTEGAGYSGSEETEPLHKLVDCLVEADLPQSDKQLAVWAVSEALMEKTRDEATEFITRGLAERMTVERRAQLQARKPELMIRAPNLGSDRIDQLIEAELAEADSELREVAARAANEQVQNFVDHDKIAMSRCGFRVATLPIFQ